MVRRGVLHGPPGTRALAPRLDVNPDLEAALARKAFIGLLVLALVSALAAGCGTQSRAARGKSLFRTCVPCHGPDGTGDLTLRTPAIAGLPDWYLTAELTKFQNDIRGAHPDDMEGHRMRPMARTLYHPGDVDAVAEYVSKLKPVWQAPVQSGDPAAGEKRYMSLCIACHGPDGRGQVAMKAPPLANQADWYLVAQLEKFKTGMRGANPQDVTGSQMRAMSSTLPDTAAMHDVVAFVKSLPH